MMRARTQAKKNVWRPRRSQKVAGNVVGEKRIGLLIVVEHGSGRRLRLEMRLGYCELFMHTPIQRPSIAPTHESEHLRKFLWPQLSVVHIRAASPSSNQYTKSSPRREQATRRCRQANRPQRQDKLGTIARE